MTEVLRQATLGTVQMKCVVVPRPLNYWLSETIPHAEDTLMTTEEPKGYYAKYHITKADGSPVDPEGMYFVLKLNKDKAAWVACDRYANEIAEERPELAKALKEILATARPGAFGALENW